MKVAIVHDYIKEFGGAERVLKVLTEMYPDAPIYTAFCDKKSSAFEYFKDKKIIQSWVHFIPFFPRLASPLRFLTPLIWGSFNFKNYDVVISSASWYITKGFKKKNSKFKEICYCHTPPRWLYGYTTSVNFQKFALVRAYAKIVGKYLKNYDQKQAKKVDFFIANSEEVQKRIKKFYGRSSAVIFPPVEVAQVGDMERGDYYFIVSRIVGAKGLDLAVEAALKLGINLKIAGAPAGYYFEYNKLLEKAQGKVEFLGQVSDEALARLYKGAKAFLALSKDEDFGITPVEAMMCGTPVIAFNGGGYKETVKSGKTGLLFDDYSVDGLVNAITKFESMKIDKEACEKQAAKFNKEKFMKQMKEFVEKHA